jgi:hypothetical protein
MSNIKFLKKRFSKDGYLLLEPLIAGLIAIWWIMIIGYMINNTSELFNRAHAIFTISCKASELIEKERAGIKEDTMQSAHPSIQSISVDSVTCDPLANGVTVATVRVVITGDDNSQPSTIMWGRRL